MHEFIPGKYSRLRKDRVEIYVNHQHDPHSKDTVTGVMLQVFHLGRYSSATGSTLYEMSFEEALHLAHRLLRLVQGADSPHAAQNERVE